MKCNICTYIVHVLNKQISNFEGLSTTFQKNVSQFSDKTYTNHSTKFRSTNQYKDLCCSIYLVS